jgi:hypothetical protein
LNTKWRISLSGSFV